MLSGLPIFLVGTVTALIGVPLMAGGAANLDSDEDAFFGLTVSVIGLAMIVGGFVIAVRFG